MEEVVTLQLEAPLALVTLNRPKSLNACLLYTSPAGAGVLHLR